MPSGVTADPRFFGSSISAIAPFNASVERLASPIIDFTIGRMMFKTLSTAPLMPPECALTVPRTSRAIWYANHSERALAAQSAFWDFS